MKIEIKEILDNVVRITTTDERFYIKDKNVYASSTWICNYVPKEDALLRWYAKLGWDEAKLLMAEAGARGSRVHKGCEILACGGEVKHNDSYSDGEGDIQELTAEEYEGIMSFQAWCDEVKPQFTATEKTVFNKKYMYAGTLDAIVIIDSEAWLIDYKTSANIYLSHKAQLSSYKHTDGINAKRMGILRLGVKKNKIKKYTFTEIEDEFDSFLHAMHFWRKANKDVKPKQKDFPLSLKLGGMK